VTRLREIWEEYWLPTRRQHVGAVVSQAYCELAPQVPSKTVVGIMQDLPLRLRCYSGHATARFQGEKGWPLSFERPTLFPGRMAEAAGWREPTDADRAGKPWLRGARRMIFVSDMGDALSESVPFAYLEAEIVKNASSPKGSRHVWLWLTKRPERMVEFHGSLRLHGVAWPPNLVPMASILNLGYARRALALLKIPAAVHGFSVEPLDAPLELPKRLLAAKPWIILGGESGRAARRHPFDITWARSIRDQCASAGAPFFLKQMGGAPTQRGFPVKLKDPHGGDWTQWWPDVRIREIPEEFRGAA
jgi:protein gp37